MDTRIFPYYGLRIRPESNARSSPNLGYDCGTVLIIPFAKKGEKGGGDAT